MFAWVQMLAWPLAVCYAAVQVRRAVACVALAWMKSEDETVRKAAHPPAGELPAGFEGPS